MDQVADVKERILNWCKAEGFQPTIISDPKAKFNIKINVSNFAFQIIQRASPDGFFIATRLSLSQTQYSKLESLRADEKQKFLLDLKLTLANNPSILNFGIEPKPPDQIRAVFISSKHIFYDGLTKNTLMSRLFDILKSLFIISWKVDQAIGLQSSQSFKGHMYT